MDLKSSSIIRVHPRLSAVPLIILTAATAATTTATAATAAAVVLGFCDFVIGRGAAEFEGHADVLADFFLNAFEGALSVHECNSDFVVEESVTGVFEGFDFGSTEFDTSVLFVMKFFAFFVDGFVLELGSVVGEKILNIGLELFEFLVVSDLVAEFFGFRNDG